MNDFLVKGFGIQAVNRPGSVFNLPGLLIGLAVAAWIYYDAEKKGMKGWLWALVALFAGTLPGLAVYLIWRYYAKPKAKVNQGGAPPEADRSDSAPEISKKEPEE